MFHIGQKVVCVDAKQRRKNTPTNLIEGAIYTIASINKSRSGVGVTLVGVEIPVPYANRTGWYIDRFRPAVEKKPKRKKARAK